MREGLFREVPEAVYHGDRGSISSSQARRLLEVTPHRWLWERDNPRPPSSAMQFGTCVHSLALGTGPQPVDTGTDEWRTDEIKEQLAAIRASGAIPLRKKDYARVVAAVAQVRAHKSASRLLSSGDAELSGWTRDPETGAMVRTRIDWTHWTGPATAIIGEVKTTPEDGPDEFAWSVDKFGYHRQQAWNQDVYELLGIKTKFVFIVVCVDPPHEVYCVELPDRAVDLGRRDNRRALDIWAQCCAADTWPSHGDGVHLIDLPEKAYRREAYT